MSDTKSVDIPDEAVEAAARALFIDQGGNFLRWDDVGGDLLHDYFQRRVLRILEAAAPHMLAGVTALADAWEARGEHDMAFSKTIPDEDIAMEILTSGAQMVENARHIRNAIGAAK